MKLKDLTPDGKNANKGTAKGQKIIVSSIQQNGFGRSGLLDANDNIIAGNKSTEAAAEVFGVEVEPIIIETDGTRPVYVKRTDLDLDDPNPNNPARRLAYLDNISNFFNFELDSAVVMADIEVGFDFEAIQVALPDLGKMLDKATADLLRNDNGAGQDVEPQIDKAEELQEKWQVKPGDIWQIGRHFIICGDCRGAETWQRLLNMAGLEKVNGVFTSPPYAEQRKAQYGGIPTTEYVQWWEAVQSNVRANLVGNGSFFVNIKPHVDEGQRQLCVFDLVCAMVRRWNWLFIDELYWNRPAFPGDYKGRFKNEVEPVYHFSLTDDFTFNPTNVLVEFSEKSTFKTNTHKSYSGSGFTGGNFYDGVSGLARPGNLVKVANTATVTQTGAYHAAVFPVPLPEFFIKAYSNEGGIWLDPFSGSGTVIVACERNNRIGLGIERLEKYCAVILERLQTLTNQQPQLLTP